MTFPSDVFESQDYRLDSFGFDRAAFMAALANKESPLKTLPQRKPDHTNTDPSYPVNQPKQYQFSGPEYDKLTRAFEVFIANYPDHQTNPPKLDNDVRIWMRNPPLECNTREAHVFSLIIFETLGLPTNT